LSCWGGFNSALIYDWFFVKIVDKILLNSILGFTDTGLTGAMSRAVETAVRLDAMADDPAATLAATGG
jgi:hypothetical protein